MLDSQLYIGIITRCNDEEEFIFAATNDFGLPHPQIDSSVVSLYLNKRNWKDKEPLEQGKWIIFKIKEIREIDRATIVDARYPRVSIEDYQACKRYSDGHYKIKGVIRKKNSFARIDENIEELVINLFYTSKEGRAIVLEDLCSRTASDSEWGNYLYHLSAEELATFAFNPNKLCPNMDLPFQEDARIAESIAHHKSLMQEILVGQITSLSEDNQIQFVEGLPKEQQLQIVSFPQFKGTRLFERIVGDMWKTHKSEMQYIALYLQVEGDSIRKFAFYAEDNSRAYSGETQLNSLARAIKENTLVVGHNIKHWSVPVLQSKGVEIPETSFVWDTLEIEILLNPCRYAYSLQTTEDAKNNVELINSLFWNQLYRLSLQPELVKQLQPLLPKEIGVILKQLQVPHFAEYFKTTSDPKKRFFQEMPTLADETLIKLNAVASIPANEPTLIIAPESIWPRIAQHVPMSFPKLSKTDSYKSIDIKKLQESPFDNLVKQKILERFCDMSKTPIVENLAVYLRTESDNPDKITFSNKELSNYLCDFQSHIDCIDINAFDDEEIRKKKYKHIYTVGADLHDRVFRRKIGENKSLLELLACGSRLPFTMASTNYAPVAEEEFEKLGLRKPTMAANIWVEREINGKFAFYMNYQYQSYRKDFLNCFGLTPEQVKWQIKKDGTSPICIAKVKTEKSEEVAAMRVNTSSTQRSNYWLFQMGLLKKISEEKVNASLPVVYVVNDNDETPQIAQYAEELGFFLLKEGEGFQKLEYAEGHTKALTIMSLQQFVDEVGAYRTDKPFCVVWDNMDIDRYMLMWDKLPFEGDLEEGENDGRDNKAYRTTPRQCVYALWPIYEHYFSLIAAGNKDSRFYIIDPHFDDYEDIASSCNATDLSVSLWTDESQFTKALSVARKFFTDKKETWDETDCKTAMEYIRRPFIGDNHWSPIQEEIMPHLLEKRGDCIVSMPTGGGKSVLFQGPAIFKATFSRKLSIVVTPLRALMVDQVEGLRNKGFATNVDYINSDRSHPEIQEIYRKIRSGELALLYVTPERFRVQSFIQMLTTRMEMDGGLEYLIFDEAHCITHWGQDFRPSYRYAAKLCGELRKKYEFMFALFSATITAQVESDLHTFFPEAKRLGDAAENYNPIRQHISISFLETGNDRESRMKHILQLIKQRSIDFSKSCIIIFCRSRQQCMDLCFFLGENLPKYKDNIDFFHAGLSSETRNGKYERFNRKDGVEPIYILCSTKAFGMGMDIPNIHYVIHYNPPSCLEDYLQEVGRAGRDETMYREAFDNGSTQIPARCLVSEHDFGNLSQLQVQEQLSWTDLTEAKNKIVEYITQFQSVAETLTNSVVVPISVWLKNPLKFEDTAASNLTFYWLERAGFIKLGNYGQADLSVTLFTAKGTTTKEIRKAPVLDEELRDAARKVSEMLAEMLDSRLPAQRKGQDGANRLRTLGENRAIAEHFRSEHTDRYSTEKLADSHTPFDNEAKGNEVYKYLCSIIKTKDKPTLVSLKKMRDALHISTPMIINQIIKCMENDLLRLNETIRYRIADRRQSEAKCMVEEKRNDFALHIILKGLRNVLSKCEVGKDRLLGTEEQRDIINNLMGGVTYKFMTKDGEEWEKDEDGEKYMPWHNPDANTSDLDVRKYETFKNDILNYRGWQMFNLLRHLPMVNYKVIKGENDVIYQIRVKDNDWEAYLNDLEQDCLSIIRLVSENGDAFNWAEHIINSGWTDKGYRYLEDLLDILHLLSYLEYSPLLKRGIEVFSTDTTGLPIDDGKEESSPMYDLRNEFELQGKIKRIRLICMEIFSELEKGEQTKFIHRYFNCKDFDDFVKLVGDYNSDALSWITEEALEKKEKELENNPQQKTIYEYDRSANINVLAGPGSGKTHVLTMRCARLIYREHVDPSQILVLAYNRAVVVELKNRLDSLFTSLGLSGLVRKLQVYTFHGLAKRCLGQELDKADLRQWGSHFEDYLKNSRGDFKAIFPYIGYVFVDEFQDITENRLHSLLLIHNVFPEAKFFTIGDINQSIYGFDRVPKDTRFLTRDEYAKALSPKPYYERFAAAIRPVQLTMFTNYRSFPKILEKASEFISEGKMPVSAESVKKYEPKGKYVFEVDNTSGENKKWYEDINSIIAWAKKQNLESEREEDEQVRRMRRIDTIAVFFRKNNEVYEGYAKIKGKLPDGVKIRIQGQSISEFWREREVFYLIDFLSKEPQKMIVPRNGETADKIRNLLETKMNESPNWDAYNLDIAYTLVLNYLDSIRFDLEPHTYEELVEYIKDVTSHDGADAGLIYKIYDNYSDRRIIRKKTLSVVLTTMHKVKGLEFDVVIVTPSSASLPMQPHSVYVNGQPLLPDDLADIDEERRLAFVAFTRAKKRLHIYIGERERALANKEIYVAPEGKDLIYTETEPGMDKYTLSFTAWQPMFSKNHYVAEKIKKDDPVEIFYQPSGKAKRHLILHNGKIVGRLSQKSQIVDRALYNGVGKLCGFFVSSISVWTYYDTILYDQENKKTFAALWSEEAKRQGWVYVVQIAGFGKPND